MIDLPENVLRCVLDVAHAATDLKVSANLTKRNTSCSMKLGAPKDKKRTSVRVNWLPITSPRPKPGTST
jgi:hypothetical protein